MASDRALKQVEGCAAITASDGSPGPADLDSQFPPLLRSPSSRQTQSVWQNSDDPNAGSAAAEPLTPDPVDSELHWTPEEPSPSQAPVTEPTASLVPPANILLPPIPVKGCLEPYLVEDSPATTIEPICAEAEGSFAFIERTLQAPDYIFEAWLMQWRHGLTSLLEKFLRELRETQVAPLGEDGKKVSIHALRFLPPEFLVLLRN